MDLGEWYDEIAGAEVSLAGLGGKELDREAWKGHGVWRRRDGGG